MIDIIFFFFKQKTAYEMRISDWSSDVCSSDLAEVVGPELHQGGELADPQQAEDENGDQDAVAEGQHIEAPARLRLVGHRARRERRHLALLHEAVDGEGEDRRDQQQDRKSTRLNSSH